MTLPAVILSLVMTGCGWFPKETQRAFIISMPAVEKTVSNARQTLPVTDGWPIQAWWHVFNSPVLPKLIETALSENPDLKVVSQRLQQAQAMVDNQAAEQYPTLHANVRFSAERYSANSTQVKFAGEHFRQLLINPLVLRYHLDFWGRDKAALEAAVGRALAADAELADAGLLLSVAVAESYFDLTAAVKKLTIAADLVKAKEDLLKLQSVRFNYGLAAAASPLNATVDVNQAKALEAVVRTEVDFHKHRLAALAGKGPDWGQSLTVDRITFPEKLQLPADLPLNLLARRPDLTAARLHAQAADEDIKVAEAAFYPDINLIAFTGLHSVSLTDVLLQGSSLAYAVGPSIEFPIFEGGRLRARLRYQQSGYDAAVERYNASLLGAVQEVADALTFWQGTEARLAAQRQTLSAVTGTEQLAQVLNRTGLSADLDVLLAGIRLNEASFELTTLENEQFKAAVRLIKALGGGYQGTNTP
nr:efflux transporter outer membrane subunit [Methylicorpusculum oleiharenae]